MRAAGHAPAARIFAAGVGAHAVGEYTRHTAKEIHMLIWLLVLLLVILAIGGGVALSKFLFLILVIALILALFGVFNRSTV
jgi:hypothetical protein